MIDSHWEDGKYYEIYFKTKQNKKFTRGIIVPIDFSEEEVSRMFQSCFKNRIKVLEVCYEKDIWLSKQHFKKLV